MSAVEVEAVEVGWIGDTIEEPLVVLGTGAMGTIVGVIAVDINEVP